MKCPHCTVELKISERRDIEIDYCPQCRGVWLDRGELDKLLEFSTTAAARSRSDDYDDDRKDRKHHGYKRKSFLGEIFDF